MRLRIAGVALALLMFAANVYSGWPGSWERVPGRHYAAAFESGVSGDGLALSRWAERNITTKTRVACDLMACMMMASQSEVDPVLDAGRIFVAKAMNPDLVREIRRQNLTYVVIDRRYTIQDPIAGSYFGMYGDTRLPESALSKFDMDTRLDVPFANETYVVYDVSKLYV